MIYKQQILIIQGQGEISRSVRQEVVLEFDFTEYEDYKTICKIKENDIRKGQVFWGTSGLTKAGTLEKD